MKAVDRGIAGIILAATLTNATAILINYSTSQPPKMVSENIWLAWILLPVLTVAFAVSQVRPRQRTVDRYDPKPSAHKRYTRKAYDIDSVPVSEKVRILCLEFGEGPQKVVMSDLSEFEPPAEWSLSAAGQEPVTQGLAHLPHRFVVSGRKRPGGKAVVHIITDIPYIQAVQPLQIGSKFVARCKLDRGGILPFLDIDALHKGRVVVRSDLGAEGLIVAVEYRWGKAVARSRYVRVVRAGIRYPNDVWKSTRTGKAILSAPHRDVARIAFQSRQEGGLSTDVFACDVNGDRMINLTPKTENSYDGFFRGNSEVVRWNDDGRSLLIASHLAPQNGVKVVYDEPDHGS